MFGRYVTIENKKIFVFCSPETPLSEVCRRASLTLEREEKEAHDARGYAKAYRYAISSPDRGTP
jgi:hypothetical protein